MSGGVCPAGCPIEVYVVIGIFDLGPMCTQYSRGVMASPVGNYDRGFRPTGVFSGGMAEKRLDLKSNRDRTMARN